MRNRQTYSRLIQNVLPWNPFSKGKIIQFLHHCIEHDISSFDTSDFYGNHHIGKTFGIALSESGLSRDEIQLISKFTSEEPKEEKLLRRVENILEDLETDYLDLLLLDPLQLSEEVVKDVERLFSQGKLMEVGSFSSRNYRTRDPQIPLLVKLITSPFSTPNAPAKIMEAVKDSDEITYLVWCCSDNKIIEREIPVLQDLGKQYGITEKQLRFQWILQHPAHFHPIICSSEKEDITSAVACKDKKLDPVDWQKIKLILS